MNSRVLKIVSIILMIFDHTVRVFGWDGLPYGWFLSAIGRLGFPLFAFMIAFGCTKTRDIRKYFLRLFAFALPMQLFIFLIRDFYYECFSKELNIFLTFSIAVLTIWLIQSVYHKMIVPEKALFPRILIFLMLLLFVGFILFVSQAINVLYGGPGVALPILFWLGLKTMKGRVGLICSTVIALAVFNTIFMLVYNYYFQWWSMGGAVILWFFSEKKVRASVFEKYFFYCFYPLHFLILYLITMIV